MESENGVNVEDESCAVEKPQVDNSVVDLAKKSENVDCGHNAPTLKDISGPVAVTEVLSSSKAKIQASVTVPKGKNVKGSKVFSLGDSVINKLSHMNDIDSLPLFCFIS